MLVARMKAEVLYITYDGVLEPLGESQVVNYLERLASDISLTLLSFEKGADLADQSRVIAMQHRLRAKNIIWISLKYHKNPLVLSTALDIVSGIRHARRIARRRGITILHARSYVPALIALRARSASGAAFLFDMRGFWVDEKVEAGHWRKGGLIYRVARWCERRFYGEADAVVSLTAAGARAIPALGVQTKPGIPIEVIPTCADLQRFIPGPKDPQLLRELNLGDSPVIGCVGTLHNWYMRSEMLDGLAFLIRANNRLKILIVTRDNHEELRRDLQKAGVPPERLAITRTDFSDMPRYVRLFDAGLFFIKPSFSKRASAATKLAEFLGCGVPVIINDGVGDSGAIVRETGVGVLLPPNPDVASLEQAAPTLWSVISDPATPARCRAVATKLFDLDAGVERYRTLYRQIIARASGN
jgi:glycosyltransferase involved in cell wall biosynthesis